MGRHQTNARRSRLAAVMIASACAPEQPNARPASFLDDSGLEGDEDPADGCFSGSCFPADSDVGDDGDAGTSGESGPTSGGGDSGSSDGSSDASTGAGEGLVLCLITRHIGSAFAVA
jgi:hypothetical protein